VNLPPNLPPRPKSLIDQIIANANTPAQQAKVETSWRATVSTGSLLLDLAISGLKTRYGGLPGGILAEISGPPGSAKTTILGEIIGGIQRLGGQARIKDSEARLDSDYCRMMGIKFDPSIYSVPKTVTDVIEAIIGPLEEKSGKTRRNWDLAWKPDPKFINCEGVDSLAALSTRMEMEQGDKMGQRRAKEFSEGLRIICSHIKDYNILMACSNQLRDNVGGGMFSPSTITPGGQAIGFYSSVRIQLKAIGRIKRGTEGKQIIIGKNIEAFVSKNSLDIEYRSAPIRIIFGYGIDDLGANMEWLKKHSELSELDGKKYAGYVIGNKTFPVNTPGGALETAIKYVEDNNLEQDIRELVVDLWNKLEFEARPQRKEKVR